MTHQRRTTQTAVALVAVVAAVVSYAHMQQLAFVAGEGWRSHLLPLSVDGLLVAAAMAMLQARRHGREPTWLARASLTLGISASLAANIAAADPILAGRLVAAWPPLALALATELLVQQGRQDTPTENPVASDVSATAPGPHTDTGPAAPLGERAEPPTLSEDGTPPDQRAPHEGSAPARSHPARAGGSGAQERAREVFEQARIEGRAQHLSGAELARAAGVHPGTARKWLATWRAEPSTEADGERAPTSVEPARATSPSEHVEEVAA